MNLQPTDDRLVIRPVEKDEKSAGGILLPDSAKEQEARGEVIAVGPGKRLESGETRPMAIKVGQEVVYGKYAGTEVELNGEKVMIVREDDVMAIVSK